MSPLLVPSATDHHAARTSADAIVARRSPWLARWFQRYLPYYLRRHFTAVRLARAGRPPAAFAGPLLIVLNHPSWWDPLVSLLLSECFPGRANYAPFEAAALGRYRFFERLGVFGIQPGTFAGARAFLDIGNALLARPDTTLWVTAQGQFADARLRPPGMRPGVGHLAHSLRGGTILPLALEYPFWDESRPEALAWFGTPIPVADGRARSARAWSTLIEDRLAATQDALAVVAQRRDPAAFEVRLRGRAGVGGVYDLGRRLRAWLRGERFHAEHGPAGETR